VVADYKEKFIAFIDVLGFKNLVEASEAGTGLSVAEILTLRELFDSPEHGMLKECGPVCCPISECIDRDLDFRLSQVSDCAVISTEISPAGAINLVYFCHGIVVRFLQRGIMCRGYITRGPIHHPAGEFPIGTGYHKALSGEARVTIFRSEADERGTPFVEIDRVVRDYIQESGDSCLKEMFLRMTKSAGDSVALFPFQRLEHSFMIGGFGSEFDAEKEKVSNNNMRRMLGAFKDRVMSYVNPSNLDAVRKAQHYIDAYNNQLAICDRTDDLIDMLSYPIGTKDRQRRD